MTMRRRELLATAAGVTATGCIGLGNGGDEDDEGPEAVITSFTEARGRGDVGEMNSLLHEEAPLNEVPEDAQLGVDTVEVEETEVLNRTDGRATVRAVVRVRPRSPDEGEYTEETEWELRTGDGEWRIWNRTDGAG
jgi:hypothetical protein